MSQPKRQIALGILLLSVLVAIGYFVFSFVFRKLASLDQPLVVAIIAAAVTVITSTLTVVIGRILERKKEIEAHFRQQKYDQYDELLKILYEFFDSQSAASPSDVTPKRLREWQRKLILFAGPKTIRAFVLWMTNLKDGNPIVKTVLLMEDFFKALRADLGISNRGLVQGDFASLILRNVELVLAVAKTKPETTLEELGELERKLGLNARYEDDGSSVKPDLHGTGSTA